MPPCLQINRMHYTYKSRSSCEVKITHHIEKQYQKWNNSYALQLQLCQTAYNCMELHECVLEPLVLPIQNHRIIEYFR